MQIKRIVTDIDTKDVGLAHKFYGDFLGLDILMDQGWIITFGNNNKVPIQISVMTEGGSGTPTPDMSIEVDDLDEALKRANNLGFNIEYGPVDEPWGVRRFFVRDPFGKLVNILSHI